VEECESSSAGARFGVPAAFFGESLTSWRHKLTNNHTRNLVPARAFQVAYLVHHRPESAQSIAETG
jgi:hypothetical protein